MNAGAHGGEMKDIIVNTTYMDFEGEVHTLDKQQQEFSYRNSIFCHHPNVILKTTMELPYGEKEEIQTKMKEYATYRKEKQPITYPSAGSTFKRGNDFVTAALIDACGLKGYTIGGAMVSDIHAGFIVNTGNATAKDILELVEYVKRKVYETYYKTIELEIEVIGE